MSWDASEWETTNMEFLEVDVEMASLCKDENHNPELFPEQNTFFEAVSLCSKIKASLEPLPVGPKERQRFLEEALEINPKVARKTNLEKKSMYSKFVVAI